MGASRDHDLAGFTGLVLLDRHRDDVGVALGVALSLAVFALGIALGLRLGPDVLDLVSSRSAGLLHRIGCGGLDVLDADVEVRGDRFLASGDGRGQLHLEVGDAGVALVLDVGEAEGQRIPDLSDAGDVRSLGLLGRRSGCELGRLGGLHCDRSLRSGGLLGCGKNRRSLRSGGLLGRGLRSDGSLGQTGGVQSGSDVVHGVSF